MASLNYERAALVLVEALFLGDVATSNRWGLHRKTIENYRKRLETDDKLIRLFQLKKDDFEANWIEEMPAAMRAGTRLLLRSFQEADPKNPDVIHAVAGAMKILAEIGLTKDIIDARLGRYDRSDREESNPMVTDREAIADETE